MTDRELLEYAAKAAGIESRKTPSKMLLARFGVTEWVEWNPLTDDGDALRLAVKLTFGVVFNGEEACVWLFDIESIEPVTNDDPYAATRRAIVRAAAAIGKNMGVTK